MNDRSCSLPDTARRSLGGFTFLEVCVVLVILVLLLLLIVPAFFKKDAPPLQPATSTPAPVATPAK